MMCSGRAWRVVVRLWWQHGIIGHDMARQGVAAWRRVIVQVKSCR